MDNLGLKDKIEVILRRDDEQAQFEDEISLRDIILAISRGKKVIIITLVVTLLAALFFTSLTNPERDVRYRAETIVAFNFDGIEKGLDPNGNRFDVGKIKSPEVLDRVVVDLGLEKDKIMSEDLRRSIEITSIVPGKVVQQVQALIENVSKDPKESANIAKLQDYTYYPTQFKVCFKTKKSMPLSPEKSEQVLQAIIDSYTAYFYDTYSDRQVLADAVQKINYTDYDYPEVPLIMGNQINLMQSYLTAKSHQAPDFRSTVTGLSFADINASLNLIEDIELNNLHSVISSYRITRDKDRLIRSFEYRIKANQISMSKSLDEARQSAEVRDKYQKDKTMVFMGAGAGTSEGAVELENKSPMYDNLAQRSLEAGVQATNTQHDIEFITREMELYKTDVDIDPKVKAEKTTQVQQMITATDAQLRTWIELANKTVDDYLKTIYFQRAVMQITPVEVGQPVLDKLPLNMAVALVLGLMVGVLIALFQDYWKRSALEESEAEVSSEETCVSSGA